MDIDELAKREKLRAHDRRAQNRIDFPETAAMVDALRAGGISCKVVYAKEGNNVVGREPRGDAFVDGKLIVAAAEWNRSVYAGISPLSGDYYKRENKIRNPFDKVTARAQNGKKF